MDEDLEPIEQKKALSDIEHGADTVSAMEQGKALSDKEILLIKAVQCYNSTRIIRNLVEDGVDINIKQQIGNPYRRNNISLLSIIVSRNDLELVKFLLAHGANINIRNTDNATPLFFARSPEMIRLLIEHGADVNAKNDFGLTPLFCANTLEKIQALVENGADVNAHSKYGETPIFYSHDGLYDKFERDIAMYFTRPRSPEILRYLMAHGADLNAKNNEGSTPLLDTYDFNYARTLISIGADIHALDNAGNDVASICIRKFIDHFFLNDTYTGEPDSTPGDLEPIIDPDLYDQMGSIDFEYLDFLQKNGIDIDTEPVRKVCCEKILFGCTPLHFCNDLKSAEFLINHGADVNALSDPIRPEDPCDEPFYLSPILTVSGSLTWFKNKYEYKPTVTLKDKPMLDLLVKHGAKMDFFDVQGRHKRWVVRDDGTVFEEYIPEPKPSGRIKKVCNLMLDHARRMRKFCRLMLDILSE